jgi:hypothetical protein
VSSDTPQPQQRFLLPPRQSNAALGKMENKIGKNDGVINITVSIRN